jgi:hypothetical protein
LHGKTPRFDRGAQGEANGGKRDYPTEQHVQEQYQKKKHPILARNYFFLQWQKKNGMA